MAGFMPGEWNVFGQAGGSGGILGSLGGSMGSLGNLAGLFSGGFNTQNLLSTGLGVLGSMTPLGPLGGFLGSTIGSMFGGNKKPPRPRANYIYDFSTGSPFLKGGKVYEGKASDSLYSLTDFIGDTSSSILSQLGLSPDIGKFGFGTFQGSAGFALQNDPFVRKSDSPGAFNAIGPSSPGRKQAQSMGRVFGSLGGRTDIPSTENIQSAAMAAMKAIIGQSASAAGLEESAWLPLLEKTVMGNLGTGLGNPSGAAPTAPKSPRLGPSGFAQGSLISKIPSNFLRTLGVA